jgi:hypothetical protein
LADVVKYPALTIGGSPRDIPIVEGVGLDLTPGDFGTMIRAVEYLGPLREELADPTGIVMIEFTYQPETRFAANYVHRRSYPIQVSGSGSNWALRQALDSANVDDNLTWGEQKPQMYTEEFGPSLAERYLPGDAIREDSTPLEEHNQYSTNDFDSFSEGPTLQVVSCAGPKDYDQGTGTCYAFTEDPELVTHRVWYRNLTYAFGGWPDLGLGADAYIAASGGTNYILPIGDPQPPAFEHGPTYFKYTTGGDAQEWQEGFSVPYGRNRIAYQRDGNEIVAAANGGAPMKTEVPLEIQPVTINTIVQTFGMILIHRFLTFPYDPNEDLLSYISDPDTKIGTEPE